MAIGPDGKFVYGGPINPRDRGGLYAAFTVIKSQRVGAIRFGTVVDWVAGSPTELQQLATTMRTECIKNFGNLPYNKAELPIKVVANLEKGVIELYLPMSAETLVANPEMWMALAEVIDTTIVSMNN